MELARVWTKEDVAPFREHLRALSKPEKEAWTRRIINTEMPMFTIQTPELKAVVKEITKGDFKSFLELDLWEYYEDTVIYGSLLMKVKDFDERAKLLVSYAERADNWATCDLLTFDVSEKNKERWFALSEQLQTNEKPFARRVGMDILFKFVEDDDYIERIFESLDSFTDEKEYYVNMVNAWLVAECFTKQRERTLEWLKKNKLNDFTVNKAVSKCRDSYRITKEDKDMLLGFKRK